MRERERGVFHSDRVYAKHVTWKTFTNFIVDKTMTSTYIVPHTTQHNLVFVKHILECTDNDPL